MQPATFGLSPTAASHFVSSDGALSIDVSAGAISSAQLALDGGSTSVLVRQVLPASGSNAGGSGTFSFGMYLIQVLDSSGNLATHGLTQPATLTFQYGTQFGGLDMAKAYTVLNPSIPACVNLDPTSVALPNTSPASGARVTSSSATKQAQSDRGSSMVLLARRGPANVGQTDLPQTLVNPTSGTLSTSATLSSPTSSVSWGTSSSVATFGKPDPFAADLAGAALTANYTIDVPAGPKGFKPPITLAYNSAGVNEQHNPQGAAGWAGEGWNVTMGSISWAEHYVNESSTAHWQNSWELDDPYGTSATLVPPKTSESIYWDDTGNPADYGPTQWQTVPETFVKVFDYQGTYHPNGSQVAPCWRVFLRNGVMEEFGCTSDSVEWYPSSGTSHVPYISSWLLDLIIEPDGNQIHLTYQQDLETAYNTIIYPRDTVLNTVEWDSPGCRNTSAACTGAQWAPQMKVVFQAAHSIAHPVGGTCAPSGNLRCDDPADFSGSGGVAAPMVQSDFVLNDFLVQVYDGATPAWHTLRDYRLGYQQAAPFTITDPVSGLQESTAGQLTLMSLQLIGDDGSTSLPASAFGYTFEAEYYEDSLLTPTPSTNCGPSWNTGNNNGCRLWSQSYYGNSYYLTYISNGLGLAQSFTFSNLRDNMHGVTSGGDPSDPLYCTNHQNSQFPCDETDDENWSRIGLTQESDSLVRLTQAGQGGTQTSTTVTGSTIYTYKDAYPLSAQECPTCVAGFSWGNQDDNDYLDFYNGRFMGFAQAKVGHPDGSVDVHKFDSTEGWGVYDTSKVQLACPASPPDVCHNDPWWDQINALHGHEFELDRYATDGATLLEQKLTYMSAICTPAWIPASSPPVTTYGDWNGNLANTLDLANPVAPCWIQATKITDNIKDGSNNPSAPLKTTTFTYENAASRPCPTCWGRLITETNSSNDGGANGSPTSVTNNVTYTWDDTVSAGSPPVVGIYLVDFVASSDSEDGSGNRYQCSFNRYDGQGWSGSVGSQSAPRQQNAGLVHSDLTEANRFTTTCGSAPSASSGAITTTSGFDAWGNPIWSTDPDGHQGCSAGGGSRSSCTTFDGYFDAVPTQAANSLNQTSTSNLQAAGSATAGFGFGLWPMSATDPNSQTTSYAYDALGRQTSITLPGESSGLTTQSMAYTVWCSGSAAQSPCAEIDQTQRLNATTTVTNRAFFDGMGHLAETRSPGPSGDVVQYFYYDPSQRLAFKSVPYFVAAYSGGLGSAAYSIPDSMQSGTSYSYDGLGRTTVVTDALSEKTTSTHSVVCNAAGTGDIACYEQTAVADPLGHQSAQLADALGRIQYEQRFTGNAPANYAVYATAKYTYNYIGALTQILHPDGTTRTTSQYDLTGRKTGMTDPDRGTESYFYDPDGNLTRSVDARGSSGTIYAGFDALDRPIWRNTTNSPTGAYDTYTYDSTANGNAGIGRLTSETFSGAPNNNLSGSESYLYDARGRQLSESLVVGSTTYPTSSTYDDAGNALTQVYPNGETVTNSYGSQGWLSGVSTSQGSTTVVSAAAYSGIGGAFGFITSANLGGTTYQYSASFDLLGRATDLKVKRSSDLAIMFDQSRTFDVAGNVSTANSTLPAGTDNQAFCYDEQNRLTWAGSVGTPPCTGVAINAGTLASAQYTQTFVYDVMGRLTSGPLGSYTYGNSAHVHAATAVGSTYTAAYDGVGDMTCRAPSSTVTCSGAQTGAQLTYNNEGELSGWQNQPSSPSSTAAFLYDGQGNRVAQQTVQGGTTTTTVYSGNLEEDSTTGGTTAKTGYYYANGVRIAMAVSGTFSYLASDGLGSANVSLNASGSATASVLYAPYGSPRFNSGTMPTSYSFTGQRADSVSGLDYYGARYYDPVVGQFTSPDTVLPRDGFDAWGLSRFAYVKGNPLNRIDPQGHDDIYVCQDSGCSVAVYSTMASSGASASSPPVQNLGPSSRDSRNSAISIAGPLVLSAFDPGSDGGYSTWDQNVRDLYDKGLRQIESLKEAQQDILNDRGEHLDEAGRATHVEHYNLDRTAVIRTIEMLKSLPRSGGPQAAAQLEASVQEQLKFDPAASMDAPLKAGNAAAEPGGASGNADAADTGSGGLGANDALGGGGGRGDFED